MNENMKISLKTGLNLIIDSNVFIFNNKYYKQTKGAPMGSPISRLLAEFKLRPLENYILDNIQPAPSIWIRYVDDIFAVWDHGLGSLKDFIEKINRVDKDIQFTMEIEYSYIIVILSNSAIRPPILKIV